MGDYYVDDLLDILSAAGVPFGLSPINAGWERRSRSSGGFDAAPLGCVWHHTASSASVDSDLSYMINSEDGPVGNVLVDRVGIMWPVAAGAANTQGKGGPSYFSRGVCPVDKGNTTLWAFEIACNGVGEPYSQDTIDSTFAASNALNAVFGNIPEDVQTHASYTTRKIDPATAAAVQGPWRPHAVNSSGTWDVTDLKNECRRRAGTPPPPTTGKDVDMYVIAVERQGWPTPVDLLVSDEGTHWNANGNTSALDRLAGVPRIEGVSKEQTLGLLIDRPGIGPHPFDRPDYLDAELSAAW
jgi:hypothetical protein